MTDRRAQNNELSVPVRVLKHAQGLALPAYATLQAAGADLLAALPEGAPITLAPGVRAVVPTGLVLALPPGYEGQIRPRSGLALRHGLTVLNAPGTIDADYRGEVQVLLINLGTAPITISRGERIAQIVVAPVTRVTWQAVERLDDTARGHGGFGSTGLSEAKPIPAATKSDVT